MTVKEKTNLLLRGCRTIHELVPGFICSIVLQTLFSVLLPFINIYMSSVIITSLSAGRELRRTLTYAIVTALLNAVVMLLSQGLQRLKDYYGTKFWSVCEKPLKDKIQHMDYELVEDTATHQRLEHLRMYRNTMGYGLPRLFFSGEALIRNFFRIIFSLSMLAAVFTPYHNRDAGMLEFLFTPWAILIICLMTGINMLSNVICSYKSMKRVFNIFSGFEPVNRQGIYYMSYLFNYKAGMDLKLYGLYRQIANDFDDINHLTAGLMGRLQRFMSVNNSLILILNTMTAGIIYIFVALKAVLGSFGLGNIVRYASSLVQLNEGVCGFMESLSSLDANLKVLKLFFEFTDLPDAKYQGTLPVEKRRDTDYEIEFRHVSFRYPGTQTWALRDLSMTFHIGKRLALVGMNGSGKTTMIKLLCRMYDPTEGEITLNGIDIRKYKYEEYLNIFSVVFQDFKLFSFSLGQNVAASTDVDTAKAMEYLHKVGFSQRLITMPKQLATPLYKDFEEDGVEISGGEAQKIAFARALYKNAPFIILDEPTAALDPLAEFEIYARFDETVGNKTAVYISHRLSSCRFCDDIAVFHEGRLIQRGSHNRLLADTNGKYHELWNAQAQYYNQA